MLPAGCGTTLDRTRLPWPEADRASAPAAVAVMAKVASKRIVRRRLGIPTCESAPPPCWWCSPLATQAWAVREYCSARYS